jgi:hypothetical protein
MDTLLAQVEHPLSEKLGLRHISEFRVFWILEHLHTLYQLGIPNLKIQSPKCSEIQAKPYLSKRFRFWIWRLGMPNLTNSFTIP